MRLLAASLAVLLLACGDITPSLGSGSGGASAAGPAMGAGGAQAIPCMGFRDVEGGCWRVECFGGSPCTNQSAANVCTQGVDGPGVCNGGVCVWQNTKTTCATNAECPCGLCGVDGKCYEDAGGGCGTCKSGTSGATESPACSSCMAGCTGTGPSCCKGCGCACEGVCGLCHLT
jgi:hypothetical protein